MKNMNNILKYEDFINEELNWKDIKRFGRRVKMEFTFAQFKAFLMLLKVIFFWSEPVRNIMREGDRNMNRIRSLATLYNIHDITNKNVDNMSEEELKNIAEHMSQEYAEKYNADLVDDIKEVIKILMKNPEKVARSVKKQKNIARTRRLLKVLEGDDEEKQHEGDPYNEEEWEDDDNNTITFNLRDLLNMNDNQIIRFVKDQILNKEIIMTSGAESYINVTKFKDRFIVHDVILKKPGDRNKELVLIDPKGGWHLYRPILFGENPIKIVK